MSNEESDPESWHNNCERKKYLVTLLNMVRQTFFENIIIGIGHTAMEFAVGERD